MSELHFPFSHWKCVCVYVRGGGWTLFSPVLCQQTWMRATVCPVWELFFVWAYSSQWVLAQTATSASNQPSCCSPKGLHRSSAPAAMHAGNPYWHPDMWGLIGDSYLQMLGVRLWSHPGYSRITSLTVPVWANMDRTHTVQSLTVVSCYLLLICMPESRHDTHTHAHRETGVYPQFIQPFLSFILMISQKKSNIFIAINWTSMGLSKQGHVTLFELLLKG